MPHRQSTQTHRQAAKKAKAGGGVSGGGAAGVRRPGNEFSSSSSSFDPRRSANDGASQSRQGDQYGMWGKMSDEVAQNHAACLVKDGQKSGERRGGFSDLELDSPLLRSAAKVGILALPLRDPAFVNSRDESGHIYHVPSDVAFGPAIPEPGGKCYLPAINFCHGSSGFIPAPMRKLLSWPTRKELNRILKPLSFALIYSKLLKELMGSAEVEKYFGLLSLKFGMYMIIGKSGEHLHYVAFDAFRGVLYPGKGMVRILDAGDFASCESAKAAFVDIGLDDIREISVLKQMVASKKRPCEEAA